MFNKAIYNNLLRTYVQAVIHWEEHPLSNSAKRDVQMTKASLDIYVTDYIAKPNNYIGDYEPIHSFFRED